MHKAKVELLCDGWDVSIHGKRYSWNHNDPDMGTEAIVEILEELGCDVEFEEVY